MREFDEDDEWLADDSGDLQPDVARALRGDNPHDWQYQASQVLRTLAWIVVILVLLGVLCDV